MTYPDHPRVLHGMFVRKLRKSKHLANILSGGDIDSAELEPRSKKRKIVSFAEDNTSSQDISKEKVLLSAFTATPVLKLTREKVKIQIKTPPDAIMTHSVETPEPGEVIELCEGLIEEEEAPELLLETAERPIKSRVSLAEYKRRRSTTDDRGVVNRKEDGTETDKEKTPPFQIPLTISSEKYTLTTDDRGVVTESENNTDTKKEKLIERSPTTDGGGVVTKRKRSMETHKEQDPPLKVTPYFPTTDDGGVFTVRENLTETDEDKIAPIETSLTLDTYHLTTDGQGVVNKRASDKISPSEISPSEVTVPLTRCSTTDDGAETKAPLNEVPLTSEVMTTIVLPDSRLITDVSISMTNSSVTVSDTVSDTTRASAPSTVSIPMSDSASDSITVSDCTPLSTHSSFSEPGSKTPTTAVSAASNTSLTMSTESSPVLNSESPLMKPSAQSHSFQELITDVKFDDNSKPPSLANSLDKSPVTTVCSNSITPPLHTLTPATPAVPIVPSMADPPPPATPIIPPQYFYQNPWLMESRMIGTPRNFFRPPQMDVPRPPALPVPFPAAAPPSLGRYFPSDMFSTFNRYPVDDMLRLPRRSKRRSRSRSSSRSRSRSRSRSTSRSRSNHSDTNTVEASKHFMSKVISNLMKTHSESNEEKMDATTQTAVKTTSRRLQAGQGFKLMSVRSQTAHHTHSQSVQCKIEPKVMNKRVQTDILPMSDNYTQTYIRMKDNSSQTKRSGNSRETIVEYNKTLGETIGVCDDSDVAEICRDSLTELLLELGFNGDDGSDYDTASMSVSSIDSDIERQPSPMFSGASNISEGELFDDSLVNELYSPSHPLDDPVSPSNSVTVMTAGPSVDAEPSQPSTDNDIDTAPSRVLIPFLEHLHQPHIPHSVIPGLDTGNDTAPSRVPFPFMEHFHQPPITHSVIPGLDTEPSQSSTDISSSSFLEHPHQSSIPHSVIPGLDTEPSQSSTDISLTSFLEHLHQPSIPHSVIPGLDAEPSQSSTDISSPFLEHPHQSSITHSVIPGLDTEPSQSSTDISSLFLEHPHQSSIPHSVIPGLDAEPSQSSTDISSSFLEHPHQSSIPHSVIPGLDADPSQPARPSTDNDTFPSRVPIPFLEHLHQPPIPHSPFPAPPPLPPCHPPSESEPEELPEKGSRSSRSSSSSNSSATSNNSTPRSSPEPPESGGMTQAAGSSHLRSPYGSKSPHNSNVKQSPQKQSPADHEPNETECVDCVFIEAENKYREDFVSQTSLNRNQSKLKGETPRTVSPIPNFIWLRSPRANSIPVKSREDSESPPKSSVNTSDKESSPLHDAAISIQLRSSAELNFENHPITTPKKPSLTAAQLLAMARAKRSSPEDRRTKDPFDTKPSATFHRQERTNSEHAGSRSGIDMQQLMANFHQHMYKRSSFFSRIQSYPPTHSPNPEFSTSLNRSMPSILQQVTPNQQITPYRKIENFSGSSSQEQSLSSRDKQPQPDQTRAKSTDSFDLRPKPCDQSTVFTPRNLASDFFGPALPMDMCGHPKTSDSSSPEEFPGRNATSDFYGPSLPMDTIYKTSNSSSPEVLRGGQDRAPFTVINTPVNSPMLPSPLHCPSLHSAVNSGCDRTLNIPLPAKTTTLVENADSEDTISIDERADTCFENKDFDGAQSIAMDDLAHTSNSNDNPLSKQNITPEDDGEEPLSKNVQHMEIVKCTFAESTAVEDCPIVSVQTDTHTASPSKTTTVVHAGSEHNKSIDKQLSICFEGADSEGTVSAQSMDVLAHTRDSNDNPSSKQIISPEDDGKDIQQTEEQPSVKAQRMEIAKIIKDSSAVDDNLILTAHGESLPNPFTDSVEAGRNKAVSDILSPMEELRALQEHPLEVAKESSSTTQKHQIPSVMEPNNVQYESYDTLAAESMSSARTIESTPPITEKPLNELETSMKNFEIAKEANPVPVAPIQHLAPTVAPEGVSTREADMQKPITVCSTGTVQLTIEPLFKNTTEQEIPLEANEDIITRHKQLSICFEGADSEGTVSAQSVDDLAHTRDSNDNPLSKQNISPQGDREEQPSIKPQLMEIATLEYSTAVEDGLILSAHGESIPNPFTDSVEAGRNKAVSEILSPMEELRALQEHPLEVAKESSSTEILTQKHQIPSVMEPNNVQYESYDTLAAESMFFAQTVESTPGTVQLTIEPLFKNTTEQEMPLEGYKDSAILISRHKQLSICFEGADSEGTVSAQSMDDLVHTRDSNDNPLSKQNIYLQDDREEQPSIKAQHLEIATVEDSAAVEDNLILSAHGDSIPNPSTDSVETSRNKAVSEILSPIEELRALKEQYPLEVATLKISSTDIVHKQQIPSAIAITNEVQCVSCNSLVTERGESTSFVQTNQQEMNVESTPAIAEKPFHEFETSMKSLPVEIEIAKKYNPVPVAPIQHLAPTVVLSEGESTDMEKPITTVCGTGTVQLTIEPLFKNNTEQEIPLEGDKDSAFLITKQPSMNAQHMEIVKCTLEESTIVTVEDCPRDTNTTTYVEHAASEDIKPTDKQLAICFEEEISEVTVSAQSVDDLVHTRDSDDKPLSKQNISPQDDREEQPSIKEQHMEIATVEDSAAVEDKLILTAHGESIPNPSTDSVEAGRNKAVSEILSPMEELRAQQENPLEVAKESSSTEILAEIVQKHQIPSAMVTNEVQYESYDTLATESMSSARTIESTPEITEKPLNELETSMKNFEIAKEANPVPVAPIQHLAPTVAPEGVSTREADMQKPITVCSTATVQLTIEPLFKNTTEQEMPLESDKDSAILIEAYVMSPIQVQSISSCEEAPIKLTTASSQVLSEQNSIEADRVQMMCDAKTIELSDTRKQLVMEEVEPVCIKLECATERISEAEIQQELNYFPPLLPTTCTCTAAAAEEEIKFEYPEDSTNEFSAGQVVTEQQLATSGETDQEAIEQVSEINTALLNMIPASPIGPLSKEPEQPHEEYMNEYSISFSDKDFELCHHSNKDHIMEVTVDPPNDIHVPKYSNILLTSEHVESKCPTTRRSSGRQRTISTKYKDSWFFTKDSSSKDSSITSPHVSTSTVEDLLPLVTRSPLITKLKPETTHSRCDPTVESQCVNTDVMCTADTLKSMQGGCHSQPSPESQHSEPTSQSVVIPIHNKPSHLTIDTPMQSKPNDVPMSPTPLLSTHHNKQCAQTYPLLTQTTPTSPHFSRTTSAQQKPKLDKTTVKQKDPLSVKISLSHLRQLLSTVHKPSPTTETKREITHRQCDPRIKSQCGDTDFTCTSEQSKHRDDPASTPVQVKCNEKPLLTAQSKCNTVPSQPAADIRVQSKHSDPAPTSLLSAHPPPLFSPTSPLSAHPPLSSPTYPLSAHPPSSFPQSAHPPSSSPTSPLSAHPPLSSPTYPLSAHTPLLFPTFPFSVHNSYLTGTLVKNAESNQLCLVIAGRNPLDNHIEPVRPVPIKNKVGSNSSELQTINVPVNTPNSDSTIGTKRSVEVNLTLPMQQSNTKVEYETEKSSSEIVATISANEGDGSVENVSIGNYDSTDKMSVTSQMSVTESNVEKSTAVNHEAIMVQVNTSTNVESSTRELSNLEVHVPMNTAGADYGPNSRIEDMPSTAVHEQTNNANERANTRRELYAPARPLLVAHPRYHPYCHRHPSSSHRSTYPAQMKPRESTITLLGPSSFPNNLANDSNSWNYWPN